MKNITRNDVNFEGSYMVQKKILLQPINKLMLQSRTPTPIKNVHSSHYKANVKIKVKE